MHERQRTPDRPAVARRLGPLERVWVGGSLRVVSRRSRQMRTVSRAAILRDVGRVTLIVYYVHYSTVQCARYNTEADRKSLAASNCLPLGMNDDFCRAFGSL